MRRKTTPYLKMPYFGTGQDYNIPADIKRLTSIEDSIDVALKVTNGGVIKGWNVFQDSSYKNDTSKSFLLTVEPGLGIINTQSSNNYKKIVNDGTGVENEREVNTPDPHYLGVRTNGYVELSNPTVGPNRISSVYIILNNDYVDKFEEILNLDIDNEGINFEIYDNQYIDINSEKERWDAISIELPKYYNEFSILVSPASDKPASQGNYRNLIPVSNYPIHEYRIDGDLNFDSDQTDYYVFVNGTLRYEGYEKIGSNIIFFEDPLSEEDHVTVKLVPKNGILIAEVVTDNDGIIKIDNSVKPSVYERSGDYLIEDELIKHKHDGNNSEKILLTTRSPFISPEDILKNKIFIFNKDLNGYDFDFNKNTYNLEVYIDGLFSDKKYNYTDDDINKKINVEFDSEINTNREVKIRLNIKSDYTQVEGILETSDNINKENIDIEVDGSKINNGKLNEDVLPVLSHIGINNEKLKPSLNKEYNEYIHRVESFNVDLNHRKEFFPVLKNKVNARNAKFITKDPESNRLYSCASNYLLYSDRPFKSILNNSTVNLYYPIEGEYPYDFYLSNGEIENNDYFDGWTSASFFDITSDNDLINENHSFDKISFIKNSINSEYKRLAFNAKYVCEFENIEDKIEIKNIKEIDITDSCQATGLLNLTGNDYTSYILSDNGFVYLYEYSKSLDEYDFLNITSESILWENSNSIFKIEYNNQDSVFVGTSDGDLYVNYLSYLKVNNSLDDDNTSAVGDFHDTHSPIRDGNIIITSYDDEENKNIFEKTTINNYNESTLNLINFRQEYQGLDSENYYRTVILKDWEKINTSSFGSAIKDGFYAFGHIFILTENNIYFSKITENVNYFSNLIWESADLSLSGLNDFCFVGDSTKSVGYILIASNNNIYRCYFNGNSLTISISMNNEYGSVLNSLLFPAYKIDVIDGISRNSNTAYVCTKYGIFFTPDGGVNWRNTLQVLGHPEDKNNNFISPSKTLKVIEKNNNKNRLYVIKEKGSYGYGYGYGYGEGYDYFDVIEPNYISNFYGYGDNLFESNYVNSYGYGYGYELLRCLEGVEESDWIYSEDGSSNKYKYSPLRIVGKGVDSRGIEYVDVEEFSGHTSDISKISKGQEITVYKKTNPLAFIDDIPQSTLYDNDSVTEYDFNYYKQSIIFNIFIDYDYEINIASRYNVYNLLNTYDLTWIENIEINNGVGTYYSNNINEDQKSGTIYLSLNDINIENWIKDGNNFKIEQFFNDYHILKLYIDNLNVSDSGQYIHSEIEDKLSVEELGLGYEIDAIRSSNFMSVLMSVNHYFNSQEETKFIEGTVDEVVDYQDGNMDPFINDIEKNLSKNSLSGQQIIFYDDKNTVAEFTISSNLNDRIFIQRYKSYKHYYLNKIEEVTNPTLIFNLGEEAFYNSIKIYDRNSIIDDSYYSFLYQNDNVIKIYFNSSIAVQLDKDVDLWISYVSVDNLFNLENIVQSGYVYKINNSISSPFQYMENVYVSDYKNPNFPINIKKSFIENSICEQTSQNDETGIVSDITTSLYSDSDNLFVGTNKGIYFKNDNLYAYYKTGVFLNTIDASGSVEVPNNINGYYIEYDKNSKKWTVTWGGGTQEKSENKNLLNIKVNQIAIDPFDENIIYAATDRGLYKTNNDSYWECIWDTISYSETRDNPEIFDIHLDNKHPNVLNAVLNKGLFRSYDSANSWFLIIDNGDYLKEGAFCYRNDSSKSSSEYFFINKELHYKKDFLPNEFASSSNEKIYKADMYIKNDKLFVYDIGLKTSILNTYNSNNYLFVSSNINGVYCSNLFGNNPETYDNFLYHKPVRIKTDRNLNDTYCAFINGELFNNEDIDANMVKTQAFGDINHSLSSDIYSQKEYWGYHIFVDYENKKTYISADFNSMNQTIPDDGECVGYRAKINGVDSKSSFKIVGNYNRGIIKSKSLFKDFNDKTGNFYRIEFVLDGVIYKDQIKNYDYVIEEEDYAIFSGNRLERIFDISYFGERNGSVNKLSISNIDGRVYAVKDNLFSNNETILILDFYKNNISENWSHNDNNDIIPSFLGDPSISLNDDALKGYLIGDNKQGYLYEIYSSKQLIDGDKYYVDDNNRIQYALRIENENNPLSNLKDPYNIWFRMDHVLLNNVAFSCEIYDTIDANEGEPIHYSVKYFSDDFTEGSKEDVVWIGFEDGWIYDGLGDDASWVPSSKNDLIGKYIGHKDSNIKYQIIDAEEVTMSYSYGYAYWDYEYNYFDINVSKRFMIRIEPYSRSYCDQASIFSNAEITNISNQTITIDQYGDGIEDDSLKNFSIQLSDNKNDLKHNIASNTYNSITFYDYVDVDYFFNVGDNLYISKEISDTRIYDLINYQDGDDDILVSTTGSGVYKSEDLGLSWETYNKGLDFNSFSGYVNIQFNDISLSGNYIYASSEQNGIYRRDLYDNYSEWEQVSDINNEKLIDYKPLSVKANSSGIIYSGTENGLYKYDLNWSLIKFPEHFVSDVEIINENIDLQKTYINDLNKDVDQLWIGTKGHGFYSRIKDKPDSNYISNIWVHGSASDYYNQNINASNWYPFQLKKENNNIISYVFDNKELLKFNQKDSDIYGYDLFDWVKGSKFKSLNSYDYKYIIIDPSNIGYVYRSGHSIAIDNSSLKYHKCLNYISNIYGYGIGEKEQSRISDLNRQTLIDINLEDFHQNNTWRVKQDIYENPFNHMPDRSSVTCIKEHDNYLIFATDRNGIWRSDKDNYCLPNFTGNYNNDYGYDFESSNFDIDQNIKYKNGVKNHITSRKKIKYHSATRNNLEYYHMLEKFYIYKVYNTNGLFNDLDTIRIAGNIENIINSYLLISETISESYGVEQESNSKVKVFVIKNINYNGSYYSIKLSSGRVVGESNDDLNPFYTRTEIPMRINRWNNDLNFDDWAQIKCCIFDFSSYEKIDNGLPKIQRKNSNQENENKLFIKDMVVLDNNYCYLACGINGIYYTENINATNVYWQEWKDLNGNSFSHDATSIDILNNRLIVGTWGDGVFTIGENGTEITESNEGLNHKKIWSVFVASDYDKFEYGYGYGYGLGADYFDVLNSDLSSYEYGYGTDEFELVSNYGYGYGYELSKRIYIGTENGGIYSRSLDAWVREGCNDFDDYRGGEVVRSRIFQWKIEGQSVHKGYLDEDEDIDYSNANNLLAYAWGGGIMVQKANNINQWQQLNDGLENYYVQDVAICSNNKNISYAATCGGGVFRNDHTFNDGSWKQLSTEGLPETLNIDRVEVGTDPNCVFVNARINDLSVKDIPYWLRNHAEIGLIPVPQSSFIYEYENGVERESRYYDFNKRYGYYKPLCPHVHGDRKHIVYKGIYKNGDITWYKIIDKDSESNNQFLSSVYGLKIVPGTKENVKCLYKYIDKTGDNYNDIFAYINVNGSDADISEKYLTNDLTQYGIDLLDDTERPRVDLSIDSKDINTAYITIASKDIDSNNFGILRTDSDGDTWTNITPDSFKYKSGFNSKIQISTLEDYNIEIGDGLNNLSLTLSSYGVIYENNQTFIYFTDQNKPYLSEDYALNKCHLFFDDSETLYEIDNNYNDSGLNFIVVNNNIESLASNAKKITINCLRPIYSNFNNNIYSSVNKGYTWAPININNEDIFGSPNVNIIGMVNNPISSIDINDVYGDAVERSRYILIDYNDEILLYQQNNNYSQEIVIDQTGIYSLSSSKILENSLSIYSDDNIKYLFISQTDKIIKIQIEDGTSPTNIYNIINQEVLVNNQELPNINIQYPLTVSAYNGNMCFVSNNKIYTSSNVFNNTDTYSDLKYFNGSDIKKIVFGTDNINERHLDEMFICVNRKKEYNNITAIYKRYYSEYNTNEIIISGANNQLKSGYNIKLINENEIIPYNFKIENVLGNGGNNLELLNTVQSYITSYSYSPAEDKTAFNISIDSFDNYEKYYGSVLKISTNDTYTDEFYKGIFEEAEYLDNANVRIFIEGDHRDKISYKNIDFNNKYLYIRIGKISDAIDHDFQGSVVIKKDNIFDGNGLYYSKSRGNGLVKISNNILNDNIGCDNIHLFDNGSINAVFSDNELSKILCNVKWILNDDIKHLDSDENGNILLATSNGIIKCVRNEEGIEFSNYYNNNFVKIFNLDMNEYHAFDINGNYYRINKQFDWEYNGNQFVNPYYNKNIMANKIIKDSNEVYWIGSDRSLIAIYNGEEKVIFDNTYISDIIEDINNNIWICKDFDGLQRIRYNIHNNTINILDNEIYFNNDNLNIKYDYNDPNACLAVEQKKSMKYIAQGSPEAGTDPVGGSDPYISLKWESANSYFDNALLLRNKTYSSPDLEQIKYDSSKIRVIDTVESVTYNELPAWKITITSSEDMGADSLQGKYVYLNSKQSQNKYEILTNDNNSFTIYEEVETPLSGNTIMICDSINNSDIMYVGGDTEFNDFSIISSSSNKDYYYHLYKFNKTDKQYILIDNIKVSFNENTNDVKESLELFIGTDSGVVKYNYNDNSFEKIYDYGIVSNLFIDSLNRLWIISQNEIILYSINKVYTISDFFPDYEGYFEIRNCAENNNGYMFISTNIGLVEYNLKNNIINTYNSKSDKVNRRNSIDEYILDKWSVVNVFDKNNIEFSKALNDIEPEIYINNEEVSPYSFMTVSKNGIYYTENFGYTWNNILQSKDDFKYSIEYKSEDNIISGYFFCSNDTTYITDSSKQSKYSAFEEISYPSIFNDSIIGSPANFYLSESTFGSKLYVGVFNENIQENEKEIVKIDLDNELYSTNYDIITSSNGLSIQSTYCFIEDSDKVIYAGCKDNVLMNDFNSSTGWRIIPFQNDSNKSPKVFTNLDIIEDSDVLGNKVLYSTYTNLYWKNQYLNNDDIGVYAFRVGLDTGGNFLNNRDHMLMKYDLKKSFIDETDNTSILNYDSNVTSGYLSQKYNINLFNGHIGALKYCNSSRMMFVGGFDNSIITIPFTAEYSNNNKHNIIYNDSQNYRYNKKENISFRSGCIDLENAYLPYTNEYFYYNSKPKKNIYGNYFYSYLYNYLKSHPSHPSKFIPETGFSASVSYIVKNNRHCGSPVFDFYNQNFPSKYDVKLRPLIGSGVGFLDSDQGYAAFSEIGQRDRNDIIEYQNVSNNDNTIIMKTNDSGMTWQSYIDNNEFISSNITAFNEEIYISSYYGYGYDNIGLFKIENGEIIKQSLNDFIPINSTQIIDSYLYVNTNGYGIYKLENNSFNKYSSRFTTENGLNVGKWYVNDIDVIDSEYNNVFAATKHQGVIQTEEGSDVESAKWYFDNNGLPSANINKVKILPQNKNIILAGVESDGLYRKDIEKNKYFKITSGLPSSYDVQDIFIDEESQETYAYFKTSGLKNPTGNLIILRSPYLMPKVEPSDGTSYSVGDVIDNADIIYIGSDTFNTEIYKDKSNKLRGSIPYYYRFYSFDSNKEYNEINIINGYIEFKNNNTFTSEDDDFVGKNLEDRVVNLSDQVRRVFNEDFVISENTDNTFTVTLDTDFRELNLGRFHGKYINREFSIKSTLYSLAQTIYPIYIVINDLNDNKSYLYKSIDNGLTFEKVIVKTYSSAEITDIQSVIITKAIVKSLSEKSNIYIYIISNNNLYRSQDGGVTWEQISTNEYIDGILNEHYNGLPDLTYSSDKYIKILSDQEDLSIIYVLTDNGKTFRTVDNGSYWNEIYQTNKDINNINITSNFTNYFYIATDGDGIYRFDDSVRDTFIINIETDSIIEDFDIDMLEYGDIYKTDVNSIYLKTKVKNDHPSNTKEQINFQLSDDSNYVSFKFTKNNEFANIEDIKIGNNLENPNNNPFILQNPYYVNNKDIYINDIYKNSQYIYASTNKGLYKSNDLGYIWNKQRDSSLPKNIFKVNDLNESLAIGTDQGLWQEDNNNYKYIELKNSNVYDVWSVTEGNRQYVYRVSDSGLYITIYGSKSLVTYTGTGKQNTFCWGDIFNPKDGNWSNITQEIIDEPRIAETRPGVEVAFDDWDGALIVRKGPFLTYDKAYQHSVYNDIWYPIRFIGYPTNGNGGTGYENHEDSAIFDGSGAGFEYKRDQNIYGWTGIVLPNSYLGDGNIVVGNIKNRRGNPPGTSLTQYYIDNELEFDSGPTPTYPIIDRVQPIGFNYNISQRNIPDSIVEDIEEYEEEGGAFYQRAKAPELIENMYYIYKIYPWTNIPDPTLVHGEEEAPRFPDYWPRYGDTPDAYTYILDIDNFAGSSTIFTGTNTIGTNWIVGTDNGIFYSKNNGMDVYKVKNINGRVNAILYTVNKIAIAGIVSSNNTPQIMKSNNLEEWINITSLNYMFYQNKVNRVYDITEHNNKIYIATNAGLYSGDADGSNWTFEGKVGDTNSLNGKKILGQEFKVD